MTDILFASPANMAASSSFVASAAKIPTSAEIFFEALNASFAPTAPPPPMQHTTFTFGWACKMVSIAFNPWLASMEGCWATTFAFGAFSFNADIIPFSLSNKIAVWG